MTKSSTSNNGNSSSNKKGVLGLPSLIGTTAATANVQVVAMLQGRQMDSRITKVSLTTC